DLAGDVGGNMARIVLESVEAEPADVVEGDASDAVEDGAEVPDLAALQALVPGQYLLSGDVEYTVEAPEHGKWQDDLAVVRLLVIAPEQVGNAPDKAGDLVETLKLACSVAV